MSMKLLDNFNLALAELLRERYHTLDQQVKEVEEENRDLQAQLKQERRELQDVVRRKEEEFTQLEQRLHEKINECEGEKLRADKLQQLMDKREEQIRMEATLIIAELDRLKKHVGVQETNFDATGLWDGSVDQEKRQRPVKDLDKNMHEAAASLNLSTIHNIPPAQMDIEVVFIEALPQLCGVLDDHEQNLKGNNVHNVGNAQELHAILTQDLLQKKTLKKREKY